MSPTDERELAAIRRYRRLLKAQLPARRDEYDTSLTIRQTPALAERLIRLAAPFGWVINDVAKTAHPIGRPQLRVYLQRSGTIVGPAPATVLAAYERYKAWSLVADALGLSSRGLAELLVAAPYRELWPLAEGWARFDRLWKGRRRDG